jgi:UDP-2,3-diacylglucosamine pyrophosphatase LpxH
MEARRGALASSAHQGRRNRTLFLSDLHLATHACRAPALLDFLEHNEADTIYLVGDIIDFWHVNRGGVWPQAHSDVVLALLRKMRGGTRVIFLPGNHDEGLRDFCGVFLPGIEIARECVHATADGLRLLVTHGDEFDVIVRYARWLALLGGHGNAVARMLNAPLRWVRRRLGFGLWSLSAFIKLKLKVKTAVNFIGAFENALVAEARSRGLDGVVCGHIHHAQLKETDGIRYVNCGDWVESCTAIAEDDAGRLHLIDWRQTMREAMRPRWAAASLEKAA